MASVVGGGDSEHPFPRNVPNGGGEANPRLGRGWTDLLKPFVFLRFYEFFKFETEYLHSKLKHLHFCSQNIIFVIAK